MSSGSIQSSRSLHCLAEHSRIARKLQPQKTLSTHDSCVFESHSLIP